MSSVVIAGTGSYIPERVVTNDDMAKIVDTNDEWITSRTGIRERRFASDAEAASDLGIIAAQRALADAGMKASELDAILVATCTGDMIFPNTASVIQHALGARQAFCMDLSAACSGFIFALKVAKDMIRGGSQRTILVIGAEKMTSLLDWQDRNTCILFGDAAGAAVLTRSEEPNTGILVEQLSSDGSLGDLLKVPAGGSRLPLSEQVLADRMHCLKMQGREVFKHAVTNMTQAALNICEAAGLHPDQVALYIPHQANVRILGAIRERLKQPEEKFYINVNKYGNTSAASVIVALDEAVKTGRIKTGDHVMLAAFGAGFTWGACILKWTR
ncbi:MAG: 3-oxoacyl-[acyl-carrier-protein] synthase-3 [Kiritimatiellia bacterium]|jgi:3-oxoacyl-[acyl-carrier-protein] synthase-3